MKINDELYCDGCFLLIGKQKHAAFKKPGTSGESPENYMHFHNRSAEDCWEKRQAESLRAAATRQAA